MSLQDRTESLAPPPDMGARPTGLPHAPRSLPGFERRNSLVHTLMATVREPMAVLDRNLRVIAASNSYYRMFPVAFAESPEKPFCEPIALGWNAFALQTLSDAYSCDIAAEDVEIELDVPEIGPRRMLLNARRASDKDSPNAALLVGLRDVGEAREADRLTDALAGQQAVLLREAHHRIANSLQIIASILLLKARSVASEETRAHLRDVHKRLILVAAVQRQLCSDGMQDEVEFGPYVAQLCKGLAASMTDGDAGVTILTHASAGTIKSDDAVSFGLIITELVINALKHGFPDGRKGRIEVDFTADGADWRLTIRDDGVGRAADAEPVSAGLGTNIVAALAGHLKARVEIAASATGFFTSIVYSERP